jgi:three-Cys-motif partner protein
MPKSNLQSFGGEWTVEKLKLLQGYLQAYVQVLKNQSHLKTLYIDAFAGTGYIEMQDSSSTDLFSGLEEFRQPDIRGFIQGSTEIALSIIPSFHEYHFIEKSNRKSMELDQLKTKFSTHKDKINVYKGDANDFLLSICKKHDWQKTRAVVFLDPCGMSVDWSIVEMLGKTGAVDLWYLFPLGVAVNRLLTKSGKIPPSWQNRLNKIFGDNTWSSEFYRVDVDQGLFGQVEQTVKVANFDSISQYFTNRLKTAFAGVAERPLQLFNSSNIPIYLFCFATANPNAVGPALRIANHLLQTGRSKKKN